MEWTQWQTAMLSTLSHNFSYDSAGTVRKGNSMGKGGGHQQSTGLSNGRTVSKTA